LEVILIYTRVYVARIQWTRWFICCQAQESCFEDLISVFRASAISDFSVSSEV